MIQLKALESYVILHGHGTISYRDRATFCCCLTIQRVRPPASYPTRGALKVPHPTAFASIFTARKAGRCDSVRVASPGLHISLKLEVGIEHSASVCEFLLHGGQPVDRIGVLIGEKPGVIGVPHVQRLHVQHP